MIARHAEWLNDRQFGEDTEILTVDDGGILIEQGFDNTNGTSRIFLTEAQITQLRTYLTTRG